MHYWITRGILLLAAYLFYIWSWNSAFAEPAPDFAQHITINSSGPNTIGHIHIGDHETPISDATWLYVKKALDHYKETKPAFIILELNTPGGEVFAAQTIAQALKEMDTQLGIPIVAYINNWAISAGALLAYSSRYIVVSKDASMGAAEPVISGAEGTMETASEKVNSAIRADFANTARFFDRDPLLAEAMVDKDIIVVLRNGKPVRLDNDTQIKPDDVLLSAKGKLLTLDSEQMLRLGVANMLVPPTKTEWINDAEKDAGKWPASKMALFSQPFFSSIPDATIDSFRMDWKTRFLALLATPWVSSLLMLGLMLGLYMEFTTPGFGLPGTIAVTCLILIILSSYSLEIANWLEVILVVVGLAIVLIELFVLPTFGLLGVVGAAFFIMGLFGMLLPGAGSVDFDIDTNSWNAAGQAFFNRLAWLSGTLVVAVIMIVLLARYVTPKAANFTHLVLRGNEQVGYTSVENIGSLPQPGAKGEAATTLRPSGKVIIDDILYDAVSRGSLVEKGDGIVVLGLDSGTLIVAPENGNGHLPPQEHTS